MMSSCAIESLCLVWAGTFLAQTRNMTADMAARAVTIYFIGMTAGRFLSGLLSIKLSGKTVIVAGQCVTLAAILLIMFNLPMAATYAGLFMIGLGNGPLFPSMTHLIPKVFGKSVSQSMIGTLMGFSSISIFLTPFIFGQLAGQFGSWLFPYAALAMYAVMMISTAFFIRRPADK